MYWSKDALEFTQYLTDEVIASDACVFNSSMMTTNIPSKIIKYLSKGDCKNIIVKTSVTGKRKINHEIDITVLDLTLKTIHEFAPKANLILADAPAYVRSYEKKCIRLGFYKIANKYQFNTVDLNYDDYIMVGKGFPVSERWLNADKIINICKAKTHKRFGVTLSTKNLLGTLSGEVLGYPKLSYRHEHVPQILFDIISISPEMLCIIDGIDSIEGFGPMRGKVLHSDFLITGTNPYACDTLGVVQMGFHPAVVPNCIGPFESTYEKSTLYDIKKFKITDIIFEPSFTCSWMYKSLYSNCDEVNDIYTQLSKGVRRCWENVI